MPASPLLGRRERLWPTVAISAAVHAALIGVALWAGSRGPRIDLEQKPIVARLVRQGELRPRELLPRKEASPPPAPREPDPAPTPPAAEPPPPAKVAAPAPAAAPPKPAPPAKAGPARAGTGDALASALSRIEKDQKVYGDPDGHPLGDADEGEAGDQYLALVSRALQESYVLPTTISERDRMHLRAVVVLYIEADGRVSRHEFESRSGNAVFDAALERAIRSARLPPPPAEHRARYRSQGLAVLYRIAS
jgi:colicin import membrane protein/protein TonB